MRIDRELLTASRAEAPVSFALMKTTFLDFEQPIAELETKIEELRFVQDDSAVDISQEIERLSKKSRELTKEIYGKLNAWQVSKVARHPQRPRFLDYVRSLCSDMLELHGDRRFGDDGEATALLEVQAQHEPQVGDIVAFRPGSQDTDMWQMSIPAKPASAPNWRRCGRSMRT